MSWQEQVRARLPEEKECAALVDAILAGFAAGGPEAVAAVIRRQLDAVETALDEQLRKLEEKL